ncbi:hypothetical protein [Vibrio mimicus]|uniref:hypothetical protein n=1 Tax=Vibrio mimicus TaxID=674 RepID=UPI00076B502A|nr:hypothetical protein [Vibrio mimicus]MBY7900648.1 hypothetical protein [Vibrio fluvialis]AMG03870.1 hypothetical protein AL543_13145 [Vibrio mimicus]KAA3490901.1 hypothetical protein Y058_19650 [Vibrio mimicus]MBY7939151.1 hypothetical protein [Vibrio fluvialis]MBY8166096.1 hypothetical protein [Vibrio fluvialis]
MKLETRMRQSIQHRRGVVLSRSDLAPLGSKTQVTHALSVLVKNGELLRLSQGVYAKAIRAGNDVKVQGRLDVIIREAASKLGFQLHQKGLSFEKDACSGEIIVEVDTPRVNRKLIINGKTICFRSYSRRSCIKKKTFKLAKTPPTKGVARYVSELAHHYNVSYCYNTMDKWADAVTRLAGDEVVHDTVEDLLVALKRAGKITKQEVAMLSVNYLREQKQSV